MNGTETSRYFGKTQHFDTGNASYIFFFYGHEQNVIEGTKGFVRSIVLLILNRAFERLLTILIPFR